MTENNENLNDLLSNFFDDQQRAELRNNIRLGDELFEANPAASPSAELIDSIKQRISSRLTMRRYLLLAAKTFKITAAAVIVIFLAVNVKLFVRTDTSILSPLVASLWEDETRDSSTISILAAEMEDVESDMLNIRLNEYNNTVGSDVDDLEEEIIELCGDFWKG